MPPPPLLPSRSLKRGYDYIVVGSGSGGAAVTRRLVDAGADVLLIEAGPAGIGVADIDDPARWTALIRSGFDWGYDYAPSPLVDGRTIGIPRGRVLGGSSATNAMLWYRGHPADYDAWEAVGAIGWSFADVLPYFRGCEDWQGGENAWRGAGGPLRIERDPDPHPVPLALVEGARELGVPAVDDANGADNEGAGLADFNISGGSRFSSARGYLWPVFERENLTVAVNSPAVELGIDGRRCIGVKYLHEGTLVETRAAEGVVLALGAIGTPRLLMLSGIGDPADLGSLGIATRHALPGVGRNLQDHPLVQAINFRAKRPLGPVRGNGGGTMVNWKTQAGLAQANAHAFPVQGPSATAEAAAAHDLSGDVFAIGAGLMRSRSRGHLRLLGAEPDAPMEIQPNFLAEPEDVADLIDAVDFVMALTGTAAFRDWFAGHAAPARRLDRRETVAFIRSACSTFFHACGTCRMGEDELAVVDSRLALRGIDGLHVADASVIPVIPTCNTHAPATMIGERAADFLLEPARNLHVGRRTRTEELP
ncbi:GMC family oxidoreductase [Kumtagia ephedrae]|uniref:Glucose-methanol-choline oxidoreductase n=1 Tax=Kumtagia ephedrae TaxID=2116701 RepID=A0A2P7SF50_9HYPH|nr:GMC family oxidoreductase N-terminal domain-containing protein [Mesorhizobium ephedrae]PSJ61087.1 glucose-methanol-choline oxidoreductase [Mesorhizobium ephedrae]